MMFFELMNNIKTPEKLRILEVDASRYFFFLSIINASQSWNHEIRNDNGVGELLGNISRFVNLNKLNVNLAQ